MRFHLLSHYPDATSLSFRCIRLMKNSRDVRISELRPRFPQMIFVFKGEPGIIDFDSVGVTDDLGWTMLAVGAMHQGIDDRFPQHSRWQCWGLRLNLTFFEFEPLWKIIHDSRLRPFHQLQEWSTHVHRNREPLFGIIDPFFTGHPDVIQPHGRKFPPVGRTGPKQK